MFLLTILATDGPVSWVDQMLLTTVAPFDQPIFKLTSQFFRDVQPMVSHNLEELFSGDFNWIHVLSHHYSMDLLALSPSTPSTPLMTPTSSTPCQHRNCRVRLTTTTVEVAVALDNTLTAAQDYDSTRATWSSQSVAAADIVHAPFQWMSDSQPYRSSLTTTK